MKDEIKKLCTVPKVARLASQNIIQMRVTLPSGAMLLLSSGQEYVTADPADIEFLSKIKGIIITDVGDAAFRRYYTKLFQELPSVYNEEMPVDEIQDFKWTTEEEQAVVEELRKRGYTINPTSIETEKAYAPVGDDKVKAKEIEQASDKMVKETPEKRSTSIKSKNTKARKHKEK
jgi:hypothetical protein